MSLSPRWCSVADHSPLPWRLDRLYEASIVAGTDGDPSFELVAECHAPSAFADAALIVRAVNNHDRLVAALEAICDEEDGGLDDYWEHTFGRDIVKDARAVLADVKAQS